MTDPPMYNVANAVFCRSLAIVRSLSLPGCDVLHMTILSMQIKIRCSETYLDITGDEFVCLSIEWLHYRRMR